MDQHQNGDTGAVARALTEAPCSLRALARAAAVDHALLVRIRQGRQAATPGVTEALAEALAGWGERCTGLAETLSGATRRETDLEWRTVAMKPRPWGSRRGKGSIKALKSPGAVADRVVGSIQIGLECLWELREPLRELDYVPEWVSHLREARRYINALIRKLEDE